MSMILTQVARLAARFDELTNQMADPAVAADFSRLNELDRERNEIEEIAQTYRRYQEAARQLADNQLLLADGDDEIRMLAELEIEQLEAEMVALENALRVMLLPKDPKDDRHVIVEVRAGTGGEEAGLFAAELYRMYVRWAEAHRLQDRGSSA
jgi:peptide chain release factor 1